MADALRGGREPRLNGEFAFHTLETLVRLEESAKEREAKKVKSRYEITPIMPMEAVWGPDRE